MGHHTVLTWRRADTFLGCGMIWGVADFGGAKIGVTKPYSLTPPSSPEWIWRNDAVAFHILDSHNSMDAPSVLGFGWWHADTEDDGISMHGATVFIPIWFPTLLALTMAAFVWRKTGRRGKPAQGFPVETAVPHA